MTSKHFKFLSLTILLVLILAYNACQIGDGGQKVNSSTTVGNPFKFIAKLPQSFIASNYPTDLSGNILKVGPNAGEYPSCQAAIDAAQAGDQVAIDAGFVCAPIILKNKGVLSKYIVIRSADLASVSSDGNRVNPSNDGLHLAVVESPAGGLAINCEASANHYYLAGLEVRVNSASTAITSSIVNIGFTSSALTLTSLPHDIIFARDWVHGSPNQETVNAFGINGASIAIVDSVVSEIHAHAEDPGSVTTHTGLAVNFGTIATGPFKISNNELESAGSAVAVGEQNTTNAPVSSDIQISRNWIHKNAAWMTNPVTSSFGYGGIWASDTAIRINSSLRLWIDGNIFENTWAFVSSTSGPTQNGNQFVWFNPATSAADAGTQDLTLTNNIFRHAPGVILSEPTAGAFIQPSETRFDVENNIAYDIGTSSWGPSAAGLVDMLLSSDGPILLNHNTFLEGGPSGTAVVATSTGLRITAFTASNSIISAAGPAFSASGSTSSYQALTNSFPGATIATDVIVGESDSGFGGFAAGNFFAPNLGSVGFLSDPTTGVSDFQTLGLAPQSSYGHLAPDGNDIGAILSYIEKAESGM